MKGVEMTTLTVCHKPTVSLWACIVISTAIAVGSVNSTATAFRQPEAQNDETSADRWGLMNPDQAKAAGTRGLELIESFQNIDGKNETYPPDLIEKLWAYYQYGTGTKDKPGNAMVTQRVCREVVLGLIWDLFLVGVSSEDGSAFQNPLDEPSTELFFDLLTRILSTAGTELSFMQRTRLYRVVGLVLTPNAEEARTALESLMAREDCKDWEKELILRALAKIDRKGNAP